MKTMKLSATALYHTDNGRIVCGKHAGTTAQLTGRDLSGEKVVRVTPADKRWWIAEMDEPMRCEDCSTKKPTTGPRDINSAMVRCSCHLDASDARDHAVECALVVAAEVTS